MKPRSAKEKGSRFERDFAKKIEQEFADYTLNGKAVFAKRMLMSGAIPGWKGDILTNLPVCFELKNQEKLDFRNAFRQMQREAGSKMGILVTRRNRDNDEICLLNSNDLICLMQYALQGGWKE